jgi:beta-phosphoglucomutase family hydrolase
VFGLPSGVTACLFDLDGVLTRTASVHAAAWKQMFDDFLRDWATRTGGEFVPFDAGADYDNYVDGRPRLEGTRGFIQSRGIDLPEGSPDDPPGTPTVHGLSNQKNDLVLRMLRERGVEVYDSSVRYAQAVRDAGLRAAVVSSSANTAEVLDAARISHLFDARIDGVVAAERHLAGKPAPDTFLHAATLLGVPVDRCAVAEDAISGVAAGRAGGFALVIGVDLGAGHDALLANGADVVVDDPGELVAGVLAGSSDTTSGEGSR